MVKQGSGLGNFICGFKNLLIFRHYSSAISHFINFGVIMRGRKRGNAPAHGPEAARAAQEALFIKWDTKKSLFGVATELSSNKDASISGLICAISRFVAAYQQSDGFVLPNTHVQDTVIRAERFDGVDELFPCEGEAFDNQEAIDNLRLPEEEFDSYRFPEVKKMRDFFEVFYAFETWGRMYHKATKTKGVKDSADLSRINDVKFRLFYSTCCYVFLRMRILLDRVLPKWMDGISKDFGTEPVEKLKRDCAEFSRRTAKFAEDFGLTESFERSGFPEALKKMEDLFKSCGVGGNASLADDSEKLMHDFFKRYYPPEIIERSTKCLTDEYKKNLEKGKQEAIDMSFTALNWFCSYVGSDKLGLREQVEKIEVVGLEVVQLSDQSAKELIEEADLRELEAELRREARAARQELKRERSQQKQALDEAALLAVGSAEAEPDEAVYEFTLLELLVQKISSEAKRPGLSLRFHAEKIDELDAFKRKNPDEFRYPQAELELQLCRAQLLLNSLRNINLSKQAKPEQKKGVEKIQAQIRALQNCADPHNLTRHLIDQLLAKLPLPPAKPKVPVKPVAKPEPKPELKPATPAAAPAAIMPPPPVAAAPVISAFPEEVNLLLKVLNQHIEGYFSSPIYAVGGCVRDALRGESPKDYDFVCVGPFNDRMMHPAYRAEQIRLLQVAFPRVKEIGIVPGFVKSFFSIKLDDRVYDLWLGGKTLEEDAKQRDFTANCLYRDQNGQVISLDSSWLEHVIQRKCVPVNPANFFADPVRVLRALRFWIRGDSLEPSFAVELNKKMAEWRGLSLSKLRNALTENHYFHFLATLNELIFNALRKGKLAEILSDDYLGSTAMDWAHQLFSKQKYRAFVELYGQYRVSIAAARDGLFAASAASAVPAAAAAAPAPGV